MLYAMHACLGGSVVVSKTQSQNNLLQKMYAMPSSFFPFSPLFSDTSCQPASIYVQKIPFSCEENSVLPLLS